MSIPGSYSRAAMRASIAALLSLSACAPPSVFRGGAPRRVVVPITFPLADSARFTSGFGDARDGGERSHQGMDLFCARWTPILAAVSGTVDWIATQRPKKGKGYDLLLRGEDGNLYFYTHLNDDNPGKNDDAGTPRYAYARGLRNGDRVEAGDIIGYVGDSGNAKPAGPHLHFEIHIGKWGNAVDPEPSLREALRRRGAR